MAIGFKGRGPFWCIILAIGLGFVFPNHEELFRAWSTHKEAAQSTLVSKSWSTAWSTRPTIDLHEGHVPRKHLAPLADKKFSRYEEYNLSIHTFRLCLKRRQWHLTPSLAAKTSSLVAKWISKALKLGASDITLRRESPIDEVFGSENVVRLCLSFLRIDLPEVIKCLGLKSLKLIQVDLSIDSILRIISCCPSIEELSLRWPSYYGNRFSGNLAACVTMISLQKLTSLDLCRLEFDQLRPLFLCDFSSKFPVLKDLTLTFKEYFFQQQQAQHIPVISSRSLEILRLNSDGGESFINHDHFRMVELDVPSIRKFTFEGKCIPKLCFSPTSGDQFDSHVSISHTGHPSNMWFHHLGKFLTNLRRSKIHLTLLLHGSTFNSDDQVLKIRGTNERKVEVLSICTEEGLRTDFFNSLLDGMFRICRPEMIAHYADPSYNDTDQSWDDHYIYRKTRKDGLLLCRALKLGMKVKSSSMRSQLMYRLRDLKEVNAQELQDEVWRPQTMDTILDASTSKQRIFRFQLKWKPYVVLA